MRRKMGSLVRRRRSADSLSKQDILTVALFSRLFEKVRSVPGAVVECGVYKGRGTLILSTLAKAQGKSVFGFDSFEGFTWQGKRWFTDVTLEKTLSFLEKSGVRNALIIKGHFKDSLPKWRGEIGPISLLVLDCDLYESYVSCLAGLWETVSPGGIVYFDEYDAPQDQRVWFGPKKAIDEFCTQKNVTLVRDEPSGKVYVVKA